ncbi:MAG: hypothetical protein A3D31_06405 [Candidatus Fluviicola riflensis]|nr:MAG: hypothetical protein CHH17_08610 [Candidatus Fluviicola riflensis]OGS79594.1 MAG: hypothetical protein A3D31_06405 [Candidatus Fluviicola riflensis]OGS87025.1 MAG: hypothetical protein A2724_05865 [Fluviicola sp. RIFCSPHIGHO2_01_FULL_43_53]OGS89817.1 MAG: hypothetical protein A3E30_02615 [Fluviicola sp. RIFCSPHIGHO2_12_FULL_43_24]
MGKRVRKSEIPQEIIELGTRIQTIINERGLRTREVAHDSDMDVENLRKYLKGRQEMKVSTMLKIANALQVEVGDLFKRLDEKYLDRKYLVDGKQLDGIHLDGKQSNKEK